MDHVTITVAHYPSSILPYFLYSAYRKPPDSSSAFCTLKILGKPEGKRPLGRPRRRWVDNIRMDLQEVGCWYMDWIGLAQDRDSWRTLVSAVMNLGVPWNVGNFLTSCKPVSCSGRTLHHGVSKLFKGRSGSFEKSYPIGFRFRTVQPAARLIS